MTSIIVLEDHEIVVEGLIRVLQNSNEYAIEYHAKSIPELINVLQKQAFDFVILDINVNQKNSLETVKKIFKIQSDIKIIVFSMYGHLNFVKKAKEEGVHGYLLKTIEAEELNAALQAINQGRFYLSSDITERLLSTSFDEFEDFSVKAKLSKREFQIAKLYSQLIDSQEIAKKLSISSFTLKQHRRNIYKKLGVNSIAQLVKLFKD